MGASCLSRLCCWISASASPRPPPDYLPCPQTHMETETEAQPPSSQPAVGRRATATMPYHNADCTIRAFAARAEGFGRHAIGGLHGPLYYVTSLQRLRDSPRGVLHQGAALDHLRGLRHHPPPLLPPGLLLQDHRRPRPAGQAHRQRPPAQGLPPQMRNLHRKARDNAVRIFQDNENLKLELENKRRELNSRAKQLEKLTAENAIDWKKLDDEKQKVKPHCSFLHFLGELLLQDVFLIMAVALAVASFQHTTTVEGIYSMEGERCKLPEIIAVCKKYKAISKVGDLVGINYFPVEQEKTTSVEKLKKLR